MYDIRKAASATEIETIRQLFREYEAWLGLDLCFQGFEEELRDLPGKYDEPEGRLLLAYVDHDAIGCIALRPLEKGVCEMKRLYLREGARGVGLGNALIERLIEEARTVGYKRMRLDTLLGKMGKAVKLYASHGFDRIEPYYENPHDDVLFMELAL